MTIKVKVGDDISWAGQVSREGVTTYAGYVLSGEIRVKDPTTGLPGALAAAAQVNWLDTATGTFTFNVARAITALWPVNACMLVDIRIASPDNKWVRTETAEFHTTAGVTQ